MCYCAISIELLSVVPLTIAYLNTSIPVFFASRQNSNITLSGSCYTNACKSMISFTMRKNRNSAKSDMREPTYMMCIQQHSPHARAFEVEYLE